MDETDLRGRRMHDVQSLLRCLNDLILRALGLNVLDLGLGNAHLNSRSLRDCNAGSVLGDGNAARRVAESSGFGESGSIDGVSVRGGWAGNGCSRLLDLNSSGRTFNDTDFRSGALNELESRSTSFLNADLGCRCLLNTDLGSGCLLNTNLGRGCLVDLDLRLRNSDLDPGSLLDSDSLSGLRNAHAS